MISSEWWERCLYRLMPRHTDFGWKSFCFYYFLLIVNVNQNDCDKSAFYVKLGVCVRVFVCVCWFGLFWTNTHSLLSKLCFLYSFSIESDKSNAFHWNQVKIRMIFLSSSNTQPCYSVCDTHWMILLLIERSRARPEVIECWMWERYMNGWSMWKKKQI